MTDDASGPSLDSQLGALRHEDRRRLLLAIARSEGAEASVERTVSMHHNHLPRLEDLGYVEVDRERDRVRRGPDFEELEPLLALVEEHWEELPADSR